MVCLVAVAVAVWSLLFCGVDASGSATPLKVLFLGNELISSNDLPGMLNALSGGRISAESVVGNSKSRPYGVCESYNDVKAAARVAGGRWDAVVVQPDVSDPSGNFGFPTYCVDSWVAFVKEHGAKPFLFALWATCAKASGAGRQTNQGELCTTDELVGVRTTINSWSQDIERYNKVHGVELLPIGDAFAKSGMYQDVTQPLRLTTDSVHPNCEGTYLAALVSYAQLLGKSPVGLRPPPPSTPCGLAIDESRAAQLQGWAAEVTGHASGAAGPMVASAAEEAAEAAQKAAAKKAEETQKKAVEEAAKKLAALDAKDRLNMADAEAKAEMVKAKRAEEEDKRNTRDEEASKARAGHELINVALGGTAKQSSTGFGGEASRALDGTESQWFQDHSVTHSADGDLAPWWRVDLGKTFPISAVTVWNRAQHGELLDGAKIRIGDIDDFASPSLKTCVSWIEIPSHGHKQYDECKGMEGRFVFVGHSAAHQHQTKTLSLAQVQVWAKPGSDKELAATRAKAAAAAVSKAEEEATKEHKNEKKDEAAEKKAREEKEKANTAAEEAKKAKNTRLAKAEETKAEAAKKKEKAAEEAGKKEKAAEEASKKAAAKARSDADKVQVQVASDTDRDCACLDAMTCASNALYQGRNWCYTTSGCATGLGWDFCKAVPNTERGCACVDATTCASNALYQGKHWCYTQSGCSTGLSWDFCRSTVVEAGVGKAAEEEAAKEREKEKKNEAAEKKAREEKEKASKAAEDAKKAKNEQLEKAEEKKAEEAAKKEKAEEEAAKTAAKKAEMAKKKVEEASKKAAAKAISDATAPATDRGCQCVDAATCASNALYQGRRWCYTKGECMTGLGWDFCKAIPHTVRGCECKDAKTCASNALHLGRHWCSTTSECGTGPTSRWWDFCQDHAETVVSKAMEEATKKQLAAEEAAKKKKAAEEAEKTEQATEEVFKKQKAAEEEAKKQKVAEEVKKTEKAVEEAAKKQKAAEEAAKQAKKDEAAEKKAKEEKEKASKAAEEAKKAKNEQLEKVEEKKAEEAAKKEKAEEEASKKEKKAEEASKKAAAKAISDATAPATDRGCQCVDAATCASNALYQGRRWCYTKGECMTGLGWDFCKAVPHTVRGCECKDAKTCASNALHLGRHWCSTTSECGTGPTSRWWDFCQDHAETVVSKAMEEATKKEEKKDEAAEKKAKEEKEKASKAAEEAKKGQNEQLEKAEEKKAEEAAKKEKKAEEAGKKEKAAEETAKVAAMKAKKAAEAEVAKKLAEQDAKDRLTADAETKVELERVARAEEQARTEKSNAEVRVLQAGAETKMEPEMAMRADDQAKSESSNVGAAITASGLKLVPVPASKSSPLTVLFIGNSLTYANNLPRMLNQMSGGRIQAEMHAIGGVTLQQHWDDGFALRKLRSKRWDAVVIQPQSAELDERYSPRPEDFFVWYADLWVAEIKKQGAKPFLFEYWATCQRKYGAQSNNAPPRSVACTTKELENLQTNINFWNRDVALYNQPGVGVMPIGNAFAKSGMYKRVKHPLELTTDSVHPNCKGTYTAALVAYAMLLGRSPVGLPPPSRGATCGHITSTQAATMQHWATEALKTRDAPGPSQPVDVWNLMLLEASSVDADGPMLRGVDSGIKLSGTTFGFSTGRGRRRGGRRSTLLRQNEGG